LRWLPPSALTVAFAADTVPIAVMEIIDSAIILAVAFVLTTVLNRAMTRRGKGHAVVHAYHH
jgi:hypothetical protein